LFASCADDGDVCHKKKEYRKKGGSARAGLGRGQFWGFLEGGADKKDVFVAGPTALIAFIDLLEKSFPNIGRKKFWGFPLFRIFLFALPVDNT
jgi:hypothetical protein